MRVRVARVALVCLVGLLTNTLGGQQPRTVEGARAAAVALLRDGRAIPDTVPIVSDTVAARHVLIDCPDTVDVGPGCTWHDKRSAIVLRVTLVDSVTATIERWTYSVMRQSCPGGRPHPVPAIGWTSSASFRMRYTEGRWVHDGQDKVLIC